MPLEMNTFCGSVFLYFFSLCEYPENHVFRGRTSKSIDKTENAVYCSKSKLFLVFVGLV